MTKAAGDQDAEQDGDGDGESREGRERSTRDSASPDPRQLEDALRAHWAADQAREARAVTGSEAGTQTPSPLVVPRLWDQ